MASSNIRITKATARSIGLDARTSSCTISDPEDIEDSLSPPGNLLRQRKGIKRNHDTEAPNLRPAKKKRQQADASSPRNAVKAPLLRKHKPIPGVLPSPHPAPEDWREVYDIIKEMRSHITAPADTLGCEQSKYKETEPKNRRFTTLVYLMLSSQTKDEITDAAVTKLKAAVGGTLSIDAIIAADESVISEAINKVGFWRRKTGYVKGAAQMLHDHFDSDVPKSIGELCSLPGVGPKMAILVLHVAWNINNGIGVDSHVHRITNRLGWHKKPTKSPEETRFNLQSWLPAELHREINLMLVGFGQVICLPSGPRCDVCNLSTTGLCPSARKTVKTVKRKAVRSQDSSPSVTIELEAEEQPVVMTKADDSQPHR